MDEINLGTAHKLDQGQRIGVVLMVIFSILVVVAVVLQFRNNIWSVSRYRVPAGTYQTPEQIAANTEAAQKTTDTDGDGLTNWDENNIYQTSAYIRDTDSDGIDDGTEVKKGTNPLCAEGTQCEVTAPVVTPVTTETTSAPTTANTNSAAIDATALRQQLVASGLPKDKLDQLSDAELISLYQETQKETGGTATTPATGAGQLNFTPAQMRDLLRQGGVAEKDLAKLSDDQISTAFNEIVKNGLANDKSAP